MKHVVEFNFVPAGKHEATLESAQTTLSKFGKPTLMYAFTFKFHTLKRSPSLVCSFNANNGGLKLAEFLEAIGFPLSIDEETGEVSPVELEVNEHNAIILPEALRGKRFICEVELNRWKGNVNSRIVKVSPLE